MSSNKHGCLSLLRSFSSTLVTLLFCLALFTMSGCSLSVPQEGTPQAIPQELDHYGYTKTRCALETKYVTINDLQIAYQETKGTGPAVVLVHSNSTSKKVFEKQLHSLAGAYLRIVALDLPGHGESDPAQDPFATYSALGYTDMLLQFVDQLGLQEATFVGWSLGGHLVLEASQHLPQAKGFFIYGTPPISFPPAENAFLPNPAVMLGFTPELTPELAGQYASALFAPENPSVPDFVAENILSTDPFARGAIGMAMATGAYTDEVGIVGNLSAPLAVLHGGLDQLVNGEYIKSLTMPTLWTDDVIDVSCAGHAVQWEQPLAFNALLYGFVFYVNYLI